MRKPRNLLDLTTSMIKEGHPELKETLEGLSPVFARIIFARRMEYSLSQQQLTTKANVGLKTITRAEGGFDNLSIETYNKIFSALGLSVRNVAEAMIEIQAGEMNLP